LGGIGKSDVREEDGMNLGRVKSLAESWATLLAARKVRLVKMVNL
jgi:hypothetical protein